MIRTIAPARLSTRWTFASFAIVAIAFSAICFYFLLEARRNYWEQAQQTANNLVAVIGNDIGRNIELYGLSLQAVVDNLAIPEIRSIRPELRDVILFDRAATAKYMGSILVINQDGDVAFESGNLNPKSENHSDRDYFTAHQ